MELISDLCDAEFFKFMPSGYDIPDLSFEDDQANTEFSWENVQLNSNNLGTTTALGASGDMDTS